jgi:hypothetical protein
VPAGNGGSLGEALVDLWSAGGRPGGARSTYNRTGWHAQFSQLSRTKAGYAAMERAGLSATIETQRHWLSGSVTPTNRNQGLIEQAYQSMRGGFDPKWKTADHKISGRVTMGRDRRDRGTAGSSAFLVEGRDGRWDRIERAWDAGADPDEIEDLFIEDVILNAVDGISDSIEFDGSSYTVTT